MKPPRLILVDELTEDEMPIHALFMPMVGDGSGSLIILVDRLCFPYKLFVAAHELMHRLFYGSHYAAMILKYWDAVLAPLRSPRIWGEEKS